MTNHISIAAGHAYLADGGAGRAALALAHATIALAEQARIANGIALAATLIAAGQPQEATDWLQELHAELTE